MRPYRKEKVARVVQEIVSEAIVRRISDPRVSPLTTITRVKVSGDLLVATVFLTVSGDEAAERRTVEAMRHATGYVRQMLAQELGMRQCPELRFEADESLKKIKQTLGLLAENRRTRPDLYPPDELEKPARTDTDTDRSGPDADPSSQESDE
jgi:ribosome-binding factor A